MGGAGAVLSPEAVTGQFTIMIPYVVTTIIMTADSNALYRVQHVIMDNHKN